MDVSLRHDGRELLRYVVDPDTPADGSPRPYAHPIRTLAGQVVTGFRPADHPWHTGLSVAVAHVSGTNLWGGPTYVDGAGYRMLDDHGVIRHDRWRTPPDGTVLDEDLTWLSHDGEPLAHEHRALRVLAVGDRSWTLGVSVTLTAATRPLRLGSPATHGRAGAGYGGLFWRGADSFAAGRAHGPDGPAGNGKPAPWLAFTGEAATVVFHQDPVAAEPWFVRTEEYPGVCAALAGHRDLVLAPGARLTRTYRIVVADAP